VFYDAPTGQARVLGGGFIKSATARRAVTGTQSLAPPLAEAMRT
jgi:tRNA-specific 2-thiouridylase